MSKDTKEKIIEAGIDLVNEQGYKGATTKKIAERAGVNEVTLFRQFGNKRGIVEAAIDKYARLDELAEILEEKIVCDVYKDLEMYVREYQRILDSKREIIMISFKEAGKFPELDALVSRIPLANKEKLINYFHMMIDKGKLKEINTEAIVTNFIYINVGYFMLQSRLTNDYSKISVEAFIRTSVTPFIDSFI